MSGEGRRVVRDAHAAGIGAEVVIVHQNRRAIPLGAGVLEVAEWTYPRILRADLEKVGGEWQGASFLFLEGNGLRTGNNRIAFSPDGRSLYVCQTSRIWGSGEGLQRIVWQGKTPMDILKMR